MHRFFVSPEAVNGDRITLIGEDAAHITKVLRLKPDEHIEICNGQGRDYLCTVLSTNRNGAQCRIVASRPSTGENTNLAVHLYQGLPKGTKLDSIVQKSVELGAVAVTPFQSSRCVAKIKNDNKKMLRYNRIAYEAAKQSKRGVVPRVSATLSFEDALVAAATNALVFIAYELETEATVKSILAEYTALPETVAVLIGPEGGFTEEEIKIARGAGAKPVTLGKRILRTETAGADILSKLNILYESL